LVDSSSTITGTAADYYWEASTGTIRDAVGVSPPWTFSAKELVQTSPEYFFLKEDSITSCNEVPPHYSIRSRRAKLRRGKRIKLYNARLVPDQTPVFWLPFYTKSLIPHKGRLRIEPGHTSRDGYTAKTIFGYPQRKTSGFDANRLQVLAAVMAKRSKINLMTQDIILNMVGGLKINDPGLDLAVCLAITSSMLNKAIKRDWLALGEVGLGGEVRPVARLDDKLREAEKLGFTTAMIPDQKTQIKSGEISIIKVKNISEAIEKI
jgi:hypothetical protein